MISKLRFKNFYSFADETLIDFTLGKKPTPSGFDIELDGARLNKAIAVVGANGSGKTQFIKPLAFLSWFVCDSFLTTTPDDPVIYYPHLLKADDDTELELDFILDGTEHRYQLVINRREVVSESLFARTSSQFSYLFKREKKGETFSFRQKGFPFPKSPAESLRTNTSLIAAAHSYDIKEARPFIEFFRAIRTNVASSGRRHFEHSAVIQAAERLNKEPEIMRRMEEVLQEFDLGLTGVSLEKLESTTEEGKKESFHMPFGAHQASSGESFTLPFFEESSGTQSAFVLLERVLKVLHHGGIAVIDELDNDLHPLLIPVMLDWFRFEHTNPHRAQIIFTCHTPEVLNRLQKHQVYLCEKCDQCSEAWRLDEMTGLRADDNLYAKYMAGALGAVPEV
ncbi:AAA family ATPase [Microbulbifer celer]|uniref:ATP/GTP-binding protein n=1 Tax=Microbulbifer celer TaxID=435905 RepID=A0ABW3U8Z8_9GAMM|nr:ATP-binding protein [Microbulbifer celer]UFN57112.1 ATP-binding protein [Microbulbifer celer]